MWKIKFIPIITSLFFLSCNKEKSVLNDETKIIQKDSIEKNNVETIDYEIVNVESQTRKAMGKKPLSQYEVSELKELPEYKKAIYKIVLSKDIKEKLIEPTVEKIINDLSRDKDIGEIILFLYSDKELIDEGYDIGSVTWAPYGKLGNIDAHIVQNNNRENYSIDYNLKNNLDEYLSKRLEDVKKFGLTSEERKQVFKDKVKAEDNAFENKESEQERIMKENYAKILKKYNINLNQLQEISSEGQEKYWPLD